MFYHLAARQFRVCFSWCQEVWTSLCQRLSQDRSKQSKNAVAAWLHTLNLASWRGFSWSVILFLDLPRIRLDGLKSTTVGLLVLCGGGEGNQRQHRKGREQWQWSWVLEWTMSTSFLLFTAFYIIFPHFNYILTYLTNISPKKCWGKTFGVSSASLECGGHCWVPVQPQGHLLGTDTDPKDHLSWRLVRLVLRIFLVSIW